MQAGLFFYDRKPRMNAASRDEKLLITEIFHSIQGEGTHSGIPYVFVRLTGCNLRCTYCDTSYAFKGKQSFPISEIIKKVREYGCNHVLITGGEPLIQRSTATLCRTLSQSQFDVSIETHGEAPIECVSPFARIIMDIKTPSSGMNRGGFRKNLKFLKHSDEIKFVIASPEDYYWARDLVMNETLPTKNLLFSPVENAPNSPGKFPGIELKWLAEKIIADRLSVRLQIQLHKKIWGSEIRGV